MMVLYLNCKNKIFIFISSFSFSLTHFSLCLVLIPLSSSSSLFSLRFSLFYVYWYGGFVAMGNGFAGRCGGMVVGEIDVVGLPSWVMGLLISVVAWYSVRSK